MKKGAGDKRGIVCPTNEEAPGYLHEEGTLRAARGLLPHALTRQHDQISAVASPAQCWMLDAAFLLCQAGTLDGAGSIPSNGGEGEMRSRTARPLRTAQSGKSGPLPAADLFPSCVVAALGLLHTKVSGRCSNQRVPPRVPSGGGRTGCSGGVPMCCMPVRSTQQSSCGRRQSRRESERDPKPRAARPLGAGYPHREGPSVALLSLLHVVLQDICRGSNGKQQASRAGVCQLAGSRQNSFVGPLAGCRSRLFTARRILQFRLAFTFGRSPRSRHGEKLSRFILSLPVWLRSWAEKINCPSPPLPYPRSPTLTLPSRLEGPA